MGDEKIKSDIRPVIIVGVIFFFMLRPQEGYIQRLDFLIFLFENGLLLENIFLFEVFSLLVLFPIFILLYIFRNPLGRAINRRMHSLIAKDLIEEFDKDGDNTLSKVESQHFFESLFVVHDFLFPLLQVSQDIFSFEVRMHNLPHPSAAALRQ